MFGNANTCQGKLDYKVLRFEVLAGLIMKIADFVMVDVSEEPAAFSYPAVGSSSSCLFSDKYKTHKYSVGRTYSC